MLSLSYPEVRGKITANRVMADLSWLRVGGPADFMFQPADEEDLIKFLSEIAFEITVLPIGVCSNLIVRDGGIRGVVVKLGRGFNDVKVLDSTRIQVGAAALDSQVARKAALAGIDLAFLRTIPGTIGGAVKMNAGCYGSYIADVFESATAISRTGKCITLLANDMNFKYRNAQIPEGMTITNVILSGVSCDPSAIEHKMSNFLQNREESQPTKLRSCGSTFQNPAGFSSTGDAEDIHDLKAWKVIDNAGMRGINVGGAKMSEKHSNFMVNTGGATAADLENLGKEVIKKVYAHSGIQLEWEIIRVGEP